MCFPKVPKEPKGAKEARQQQLEMERARAKELKEEQLDRTRARLSGSGTRSLISGPSGAGYGSNF